MATMTVEPTAYQRFAPARLLGRMSVDEWHTFLQASVQKSNYVYGEVVEVAGASPEHNLIAMNMAARLRNVLDAGEYDCDVLGSDQKVAVEADLYYFPDLCVVCGEWKVDFHDALLNPCVIVEVLSPTPERDDRTDKFREYQQIATLRHYFLIDQSRVAVTHYEKLAQGLWAIVGDFRSLEDSITLTLGEATVSVPLSQIYRRVTF